MAKPLIYYYDKECEKRYPVNESGDAILDWGETIPGQVKERDLYVSNESHDRLALRQPYTEDEDLTITDFPPNLMGLEKGQKVTLQFTPKKERIDSLHAGWGFDVVIG